MIIFLYVQASVNKIGLSAYRGELNERVIPKGLCGQPLWNPHRRGVRLPGPLQLLRPSLDFEL